jgi:hypothetical protein
VSEQGKRRRFVLQPALPGLAPPKARRSRRWGGDHSRVWSDPAVVEAQEVADDRFVDWRDAFAHFVRRLPAERRRELRRRLAGRGTAPYRRRLDSAA